MRTCQRVCAIASLLLSACGARTEPLTNTLTSDAGKHDAASLDGSSDARDSAIPVIDAQSDAPADVGADIPVIDVSVVDAAEDVPVDVGVDTSAPPACAPEGNPPVVLAATSSAIRLALDPTHVYWSDMSNQVMRISKWGGSAEVLASGLSFPLGLATDASSVFVAERDGGRLLRIDKGTGATLALWQAESTNPWPYAVAVDDDWVFWITYLMGAVGKVRKDGSEMAWIAPTGGENMQPEGIAIDANWVYWTDAKGSTVWRVSKSGGVSQEAIAHSELVMPRRVAVDDFYAYVVGGYSGYQTGSVWRMPKAGGAVEVLSNAENNPSSVALDTSSLYWTNLSGSGPTESGTVVQMVKTAGPKQLIAADQQGADSIAVDEDCAYWLTNDGVVVGSKLQLD